MNLERFILAQEKTYSIALQEIKNGEKKSHWIWYIFPQLKGLGESYYSNYYGIEGKEEAYAYYQNDYLKEHLLEITSALYNVKKKNILEIVRDPDDLKINSSMTLFYEISQEELFKKVIEKYYNGKMDQYTLMRLKIKSL